MSSALTESKIEGLTLLRRGKVRDVYDLGDKLLLVATDRLSAFDHVLPTPIPEKGKLLTQISARWFKLTRDLVPNHLISADLAEIQRQLPRGVRLDPAEYSGRATLCRKAQRLDVECVARGYISGSAWKEYQKTGRYLDHALPKGLKESSKLPQPIFTPAIKNDEGHDENVTREKIAALIGKETADELERLTLLLYDFAARRLEDRNLILADTKFEFGLVDGELILIDEMLTPDSSRVWDAKTYKPGGSPASFDKQFVRDYLEKIRWNKQAPAPALPKEIAEGTAQRYNAFLEAVSR